MKYKCCKCGVEKEAKEFNKHSKTKSGLDSRCKECLIKYRQINRDKDRIRIKRWAEENREHCKKVRHAKYLRTKEKTKELSRLWRQNNLEKSREYHRNYVKHKRATDPHYCIQHRLRNRLLCALKRTGDKKLFKFLELTGCTLLELKKYIESKFKDDMSWEKFLNSEIVIDHIKPCCSYDLSDPSQQKECFHYTNLQPLWKDENRRKLEKDVKFKLTR